MTNIFKTPKKVTTRDLLIEASERVLRRDGWSISRVGGTGKSSIRRIQKGESDLLVSIKSTQDQWLAFSRTPDDKAWSTLADVDAVVVSSVDEIDRPRRARVHLIDAASLRDRFDRAYAARLAANRSIPVGRGVWISLYDREDGSVTLVGAGAGRDTPEMAIEPLTRPHDDEPSPPSDVNAITEAAPTEIDDDEPVGEPPLTIAEAKRRLAITFGVDPSAIRITVEG